MENAIYLGDGVYAENDGYQIWLRVNDYHNPTDVVALDPEVLSRLISYAVKIGMIK
jgi:hypothetical protein